MNVPFSSFFGKTNETSTVDPLEQAQIDADIRQRLAYISPAFAAGDNACTEIVDTTSVTAPRRSSLWSRLVAAPTAISDRIRARIRWNRSSRVTLAIVLLAVAVTSAASAWYTWPKPETSIVAPVAHTGAADPNHDTVEPVAGAADEPEPVTVSVVGDVKRPGLVSLPPGSRVVDAIEAAGGLTVDDAGFLNLARKISDGELIIVGDTPPPGSGGPGVASPAPGGGVVNLNQATLADLDGLPGIGPVMAQRIIAYRDANGGFDSVDQLADVDGIGPNTMDKLRDLVTV